MFNQTTSLAPHGESKTLTDKLRNGINGMSEKQVDRVQTIAMWVIGGLMSVLLVLTASFTKYVLSKQDEMIAGQNERIAKQDVRLEKLENKYQVMLEANAAKISSIDKNIAVIAAKMNVDLR